MTDPFQALELTMTNPDVAADFLARNFMPPPVQAANPLGLDPAQQAALQQQLTPQLPSLGVAQPAPQETQQQEDVGDVLASLANAGTPAPQPTAPLNTPGNAGIQAGRAPGANNTQSFVNNALQAILNGGAQPQSLGAVIRG